jgi:hypothetical protein
MKHAKAAASMEFTVRETPSMATEPFAAIIDFSAFGAWMTNLSDAPSGVTVETVATPSICPLTK